MNLRGEVTAITIFVHNLHSRVLASTEFCHRCAAECTDMVWRFTQTRGVPNNFMWWWWTFFMVEVFLIIAIWLGHTQRLFAVQRVRVTMDQIVSVSLVGFILSFAA